MSGRGLWCDLRLKFPPFANSESRKDTRKEDKDERGNTTNDNETTSLENGMKASNFEKPSLSVKAEHFNFYTFNVDQVHCTYFDSGS